MNARVCTFFAFDFLRRILRQSPMTAVKKGTGRAIFVRGQPAEPEIFLATENFIVAELRFCVHAVLHSSSAKMSFKEEEMPQPKISIEELQEKIEKLRETELSSREAAILLGISDRTFYRLVEADFIPRYKEGVYQLKDVVAGYGKSSSGNKGVKEAKIRQLSADAELKEIEILLASPAI